jgi:hypothetical protein
MTKETEVPKLCECGCGQTAPLAPFTYHNKGWVKGQPLRFVHGHNSKGVPSPLKGKSRFPLTIEERFWNRVDKNGPLHPILKTPCWEWTGTVNVQGYGDMSVEGKHVGAHRLSYQLHNGSIPKGLHVLHKCDNRICTNPEHLFIGTQSENVKDMGKKKRWKNQHSAGENHGWYTSRVLSK